MIFRDKQELYHSDKEGCLARGPYPWDNWGRELMVQSFEALLISPYVKAIHNIEAKF